MKRSISIHFKAAFLLLVFALNTLVGLACALGVDMRFNTSNHHKEEATEVVVHTHADGKKHQHKKASHHDANQKKDEKGGCCSDSVVKFSQLDKSVPQPDTIINPVFFIAFVPTWFNININYSSQTSTSIKYFVRCYHPPIPDIRIAIQSFLI